MIDLAGANDPDSAAAAVATALGIELRGSDPVERIGELLARQRGPMVLDNLEGLGANAAGLIDRWLARAPDATFLGTSRTPIEAIGEVVVEVGPLNRDAAIELFVRRAQAASTANRFGATIGRSSGRSSIAWTAIRWRWSWPRHGPPSSASPTCRDGSR